MQKRTSTVHQMGPTRVGSVLKTRAIERFGLVALIAVVLAVSACLVTAQNTNSNERRDYSDPSRLFALVLERLEPYILVDVRTAGEYSSGHIPTAINIPYDQIAANPPTRDTRALIIVYCASGHRSSIASESLKKIGFLRVVDFGALKRWPGSVIVTDKPGDNAGK